ncbi:pseudouridine synthase [Nodosilinea sp. PGN35]|uniref:pseudouridine synthase n=1 Tax=Nodosilinea sp. PGN35 TaxID=3020489 RepID=UPI0023B2BFF6|nr:pseudouridine synthase [Nodosilinea sp. TSF1-S3]MDF0369095.1 pseudouridine synthase [Nodosilinea sp. TSF1-S3]
MAERLQKILSQYGVASRRQAEQMIEAGQVQVNGAVAHLGQRADPSCDRIEVNHQPLQAHHRPAQHYLLLHKPLGMVSTCADPRDRPTVLSALPPELQAVGIHPVGRLDAYTTGALLLTNDGDFTFRLTHPRHDVSKTYRVRLEGQPSPEAIAAWRQGIYLDGQLTRPAQVRMISSGLNQTQLEVILQEGRNRQIRRMAQALGHRVLDLHRTAVGSVLLGNLGVGAYRALSSAEIEALLAESSVQSAPQQTASVPR